MKVGIIIYAADAETVWNAFRFGNFTLAMGSKVKVFLLGKGVEVDSLDTNKFDVTEQVNTFLDARGAIYACGTCLEIHNLKAVEAYKVATMKDMYEIIKESDKVVTF